MNNQEWLYKDICYDEFKEYCIHHQSAFIIDIDRNIIFQEYVICGYLLCGFSNDEYEWFNHTKDVSKYESSNSFIVNSRNNYQWLIMKFEDDWWLLVLQGSYAGNFLCDGLDGVMLCLKEIGSDDK